MFVVARQQKAKLKNPKIRRRKEQQAGDASFGWSRADCNVSVYLCILYRCVLDQYILFYHHYFLFLDPPFALLCTLIMTTMMMSLKYIFSLSLFRRYQSTSHCLEMTTILNEKGQKKGKRAYKRVTFVMVFCGINTNIMYEPSGNEESH